MSNPELNCDSKAACQQEAGSLTLGRSTKDLIELTELFQSKGVHLVSLKESIDTSTSTGKLLFTLMSAIAQFERDVIADIVFHRTSNHPNNVWQ